MTHLTNCTIRKQAFKYYIIAKASDTTKSREQTHLQITFPLVTRTTELSHFQNHTVGKVSLGHLSKLCATEPEAAALRYKTPAKTDKICLLNTMQHRKKHIFLLVTMIHNPYPAPTEFSNKSVIIFLGIGTSPEIYCLIKIPLLQNSDSSVLAHTQPFILTSTFQIQRLCNSLLKETDIQEVVRYRVHTAACMLRSFSDDKDLKGCKPAVLNRSHF